MKFKTPHSHFPKKEKKTFQIVFMLCWFFFLKHHVTLIPYISLTKFNAFSSIFSSIQLQMKFPNLTTSNISTKLNKNTTDKTKKKKRFLKRQIIHRKIQKYHCLAIEGTHRSFLKRHSKPTLIFSTYISPSFQTNPSNPRKKKKKISKQYAPWNAVAASTATHSVGTWVQVPPHGRRACHILP